MSEAAHRSRTLEEASGWFTALKRPTVTAQALRDFDRWKRDPANAAAFAEIQRTWATEGALAADPQIQAATRQALAARPARASYRFNGVSLPPFAVALASLAAIGAAAAIYAGQAQPTFSTDVGEQRMEVLKDGSRVRLNTDSKVRVRFSHGQRRVTLERGEAFFDVAHDTTRPFIVESADARVRAVGTKFDVRRDTGAVVQVTLLEGRVEVRHGGREGKAMLAPNEALTVSAAGISTPRPAIATETTGWTTGRLTFRGVPLNDAINEVNRYSRQKIVLTGVDAIAGEPVSGVFEPGDTATFLSAVETVFGLRVAERTQREIRLAPASSSGG